MDVLLRAFLFVPSALDDFGDASNALLGDCENEDASGAENAGTLELAGKPTIGYGWGGNRVALLSEGIAMCSDAVPLVEAEVRTFSSTFSSSSISLNVGSQSAPSAWSSSIGLGECGGGESAAATSFTVFKLSRDVERPKVCAPCPAYDEPNMDVPRCAGGPPPFIPLVKNDAEPRESGLAGGSCTAVAACAARDCCDVERPMFDIADVGGDTPKCNG